LKQSLFEDDEEDDDEEEEDDFIDTESLGDWRTVRRNLALGQQEGAESPKTKPKKPKSVSKENEEILLQQNEHLAQEYITGVWAHEVATVSAVVALLCFALLCFLVIPFVCGKSILSTFRYIFLLLPPMATVARSRWPGRTNALGSGIIQKLQTFFNWPPAEASRG
jgi:hypothetical protein